MNLYYIEQSVNSDYDMYSDAVVTAESEEDARLVHPYGYSWDDDKKEWYLTWTDGTRLSAGNYEWASPENVEVTLIGTANGNMAGVICASFHAG